MSILLCTIIFAVLGGMIGGVFYEWAVGAIAVGACIGAVIGALIACGGGEAAAEILSNIDLLD